jgi:hypothetical protein
MSIDSIPRCFVLALVGFSILFCNVGFAQDSIRRVDPIPVRETVESLADLVRQEYFDTGKANRIAEHLEHNLHKGNYDDPRSTEAFASELTKHMFAISKDKHLSVLLKAPATNDSSPTQKKVLSRIERGRQENFGVRRVEVLNDNVGYLKLTHFYRPDEANEVISAAMQVLQNTSALIIDLRENSGGSPGTVASLASHFFEKADMPLFKITSRDSSFKQYATLTNPPENRNESKPVIVLTSAQTFSAGEGFAMILQEHERALLVGEVTAGAANPGRPFDINQQFEVVIPTGHLTMATSGGNWEGTGVKPDVSSTADKALAVAHQLALKKLKT